MTRLTLKFAKFATAAGAAYLLNACGTDASSPSGGGSGAGSPGSFGGGGSSANGGAAIGGAAIGGAANGGAANAGTTSSPGGSFGAGGTLAAGGTSATAGATSSAGGGSNASAGSGVAGGSAGGGPSGTTGTCGPTAHNEHPFGCKFAWGIADPGGSLASYSYVQFMSYWVDASISAAGTYTTCNGCNWLKNQVASTNLIPAYYAYIIGFLAHANGIVDGNQQGDKKLTTDGAALVKAQRAAIVAAYAWYAKETYKVWSSKPLVWLLEGDFVQFVDAGQSSPMTYAEVGQLAADITCAIKANMPNAVVAIDHSSWNSDEVTNGYWGAMKNANYDMVWTTGVGNNQGFIEASANGTTYNHATATYSYLHTLTGRSILVDTSAGASAAGDSWSTASASDINARIAEGVVAANITGTAPAGLSSNVGKLSTLSALPSCQ